MISENIKMLQIIAKGLGNLNGELVFVGGSVAELYADNPATSDIRPTLDVDCVVELRSKTDYAKLEDELRAKKFRNDTSQGAPICRWIYEDILLDVMPTNPDILGFSNIWYEEGFDNKVSIILVDGTEIFIFPPEYYLASKFEAHNSRGGNDLRQSHDFEDIIFIFDNCHYLLENISNANTSLKIYLKTQCQKLLSNYGLIEGIESALPYGSDEENTDMILELIQKIIEME